MVFIDEQDVLTIQAISMQRIISGPTGIMHNSIASQQWVTTERCCLSHECLPPQAAARSFSLSLPFSQVPRKKRERFLTAQVIGIGTRLVQSLRTAGGHRDQPASSAADHHRFGPRGMNNVEKLSVSPHWGELSLLATAFGILTKGKTQLPPVSSSGFLVDKMSQRGAYLGGGELEKSSSVLSLSTSTLIYPYFTCQRQ
ncbi:uncharacterized protein LAESUDRAFT_715652 [Laetiporus sulphureus 93-53]|uniref:Uncharacterized protein n=1 Tax=Laetiporus sulphureus 93-53 TaxID=1314785 RepID=A0A165D8W9_9APHY|nr:uncharacterized protein LAESUDRAFT_715652 [Laetiporus sulphureus 93-53]KZT04356.1 hypothetical protein LAESUDRAFT_715652 [Laetiporus sulphureus 93-53]